MSRTHARAMALALALAFHALATHASTGPQVWDVRTWRLQNILRAHKQDVLAVVMCAGRLWSGSTANQLRVWQPRSSLVPADKRIDDAALSTPAPKSEAWTYTPSPEAARLSGGVLYKLQHKERFRYKVKFPNSQLGSVARCLRSALVRARPPCPPPRPPPPGPCAPRPGPWA